MNFNAVILQDWLPPQTLILFTWWCLCKLSSALSCFDVGHSVLLWLVSPSAALQSAVHSLGNTSCLVRLPVQRFPIVAWAAWWSGTHGCSSWLPGYERNCSVIIVNFQVLQCAMQTLNCCYSHQGRWGDRDSITSMLVTTTRSVF